MDAECGVGEQAAEDCRGRRVRNPEGGPSRRFLRLSEFLLPFTEP